MPQHFEKFSHNGLFMSQQCQLSEASINLANKVTMQVDSKCLHSHFRSRSSGWVLLVNKHSNLIIWKLSWMLTWGNTVHAPGMHYCNFNTVIRFFFRCKNIFVHRKRTKILYTNIILQRIFFDDGTPATTHQYFPSCCCLYILVFMVAFNTTSNLFGMRCDLLK